MQQQRNQLKPGLSLAIGTEKRAKRAAAANAEKRWQAHSEKRRMHFSATGRSVEPVSGSPTISPQPTDKSYKNGTYRLHWKGERDAQGRTSGNEPHIGSRDNRKWTPEHIARRELLQAWFKTNKPGMENQFGLHLAENSHIHAGSFFGTNDVLSAPPASIHQNTQWLAIESGIKNLQGLDPMMRGGALHIKSTGYVHEQGPLKGTLKAARYKAYIDGRKVFDHVSMGARGNIDKNESRRLQNDVEALRGTTTPVSLHATVPKGVHGTAPSIDEARDGQRSGSSKSHRQFTDLLTGNTRLESVHAMAYAVGKYK